MSNFTINEFQAQLKAITDAIADQAPSKELEDLLNNQFPADGEVFKNIEAACHAGIQAGELCQHEGGGIKYGRVIKPTAVLQGFSVDVVDMNNLAGPHHRHPLGEIDMIMPIDAKAKFDGKGAGWLVYGPDSAHSPTVTDGRALVLYLLPEGAIEFTRNN